MTWGYSTHIDLYGCDTDKITDEETIRDYSEKLVELLEMIPFGEPLIVDFGSDETSGFTLVQLIETSSITAHFANSSRSAYIDVFSCKPYNASEVAFFSRSFFKASEMKVETLDRD